MNWEAWHALRQNTLGVHWSVHVLAVAILVGTIVTLSKPYLRGLWVTRRFLGDLAPKPPPPPRPPPESDPRTVRIEAARLTPTRGMEVIAPANADLGTILGPGAPLMGPAPPSIRYEQDENVIRMEEAPAFELGFEDPLGEE